jgi:GAF domain-containing protein
MGSREDYETDLRDLEDLLEDEPDPIARMATITSLLKDRHPAISWVGYYRLSGPDLLILGPFQGPVACLRIRIGEGVCGTAAAKGETVVVPDVHAFPGHIACDPRSRSEIVLPVFDSEGRLRAVLDLDSREPAAFSEGDREGLLPIARLTYPPSGAQRTG